MENEEVRIDPDAMYGNIFHIKDDESKNLYEEQTGHIRMAGCPFPLSIKKAEFAYIYNLIVEHNLRTGYECATGFGVSGLAAALGFKHTKGKLVSMDAYIEEELQDASKYLDDDTFIRTLLDSKGYKSAKLLSETFETQPYVEFKIGWSPKDVSTVIESEHSEPLDYVFIDGGHSKSQIIKDTTAVLPYLNPSGCYMVFHDLWDSLVDKTKLEELLHGEISIVLPFPEGENLGMIHYKIA